MSATAGPKRDATAKLQDVPARSRVLDDDCGNAPALPDVATS
jgi:hypothetical protein